MRKNAIHATHALRFTSPLLLPLGLLLAFLVVATPTQAASCEQGETPTGCVDIALSPDSLTADFYIDDTLVVAGANPAHLDVTPGTLVRVEARNVRDGGAGFGDVYVYDDASTNVWVSAGQTRGYSLYPRKVFIKGFLDFTCDIHNVQDGENVACRPVIDGATQADVPPGEKATYNLEPGAHAIRVELAGEQTGFWDPAASEHTTNIAAGWTRYLRSTFNKKGLLSVTLNQQGIVGDLYVDGQLFASQTASAQVWVAPFSTHKVEVRNATDPAAGGVYRWKDAATSAYLGTGQERTATLSLQKEYLMGFAEVECEVNDLEAGDVVLCAVKIDGQGVGTIPPGEVSTYNLPSGDHQVEVSLTGRSAAKWASPVTLTASIRAGSPSVLTASFDLLASTETSPAAGIVRINYIHYLGTEGMAEADEYVVISNYGSVPFNLGGWRLHAARANQDFIFPEFVLRPGGSVMVYTNQDHPGSRQFKFGSGKQIWNQLKGDTATLYDQTGALVDAYSFGPAR